MSQPRPHNPVEVVPDPHDLRASDAERERTVEELRAHAAAGRLDSAELEDRLGRALAATRRAELADVLADLPAERARQAAPAARPRRRHGKDPFCDAGDRGAARGHLGADRRGLLLAGVAAAVVRVRGASATCAAHAAWVTPV